MDGQDKRQCAAQRAGGVCGLRERVLGRLEGVFYHSTMGVGWRERVRGAGKGYWPPGPRNQGCGSSLSALAQKPCTEHSVLAIGTLQFSLQTAPSSASSGPCSPFLKTRLIFKVSLLPCLPSYILVTFQGWLPFAWR